jgi:hypothetical protein
MTRELNYRAAAHRLAILHHPPYVHHLYLLSLRLANHLPREEYRERMG